MKAKIWVNVAAGALLALSAMQCAAQQDAQQNGDSKPLPQSDSPSAGPATTAAAVVENSGAANAPDVGKPVTRAPQPASAARSLDQVVDRTIESERRFVDSLRKFTPLVET